MLSVILPARNEEELVLPVIEQIRQTASIFPVEIIVVDGQSSDRTREIASSCADRVIDSPKACRSYQMHLGAQAAIGQLFLFLHMDSLLPNRWQELVKRNFFDSNHPPAAAAFSLQFDSRKALLKLIAFLANFRTILTKIPQGDQALLVPRQTYFAAGGFPDVPLMEEYIFIPKLIQIGEIKIFKEKIVTSPRRYEKKGALTNALKNFLLVLLFYLGVPPQRLAPYY